MMSAPKVMSGRKRRASSAEADRVVAQVAAFHPLEDQVVAMLQRQVQMRHQARFGGDGLHQVLVHLDRIDGTDPQARQVGHQFQDPHHQIAQSAALTGRSAPQLVRSTPVSTTSL